MVASLTGVTPLQDPGGAGGSLKVLLKWLRTTPSRWQPHSNTNAHSSQHLLFFLQPRVRPCPKVPGMGSNLDAGDRK